MHAISFEKRFDAALRPASSLLTKHATGGDSSYYYISPYHGVLRPETLTAKHILMLDNNVLIDLLTRKDKGRAIEFRQIQESIGFEIQPMLAIVENMVSQHGALPHGPFECFLHRCLRELYPAQKFTNHDKDVVARSIRQWWVDHKIRYQYGYLCMLYLAISYFENLEQPQPELARAVAYSDFITTELRLRGQDEFWFGLNFLSEKPETHNRAKKLLKIKPTLTATKVLAEARNAAWDIMHNRYVRASTGIPILCTADFQFGNMVQLFSVCGTEVKLNGKPHAIGGVDTSVLSSAMSEWVRFNFDVGSSFMRALSVEPPTAEHLAIVQRNLEQQLSALVP